MGRCVIIGAAKIENYERPRQNVKEDDFIIYCDGGLAHQKELKIEPDLIIGDFDSYQRPVTETETIVLPRAKDDTDTLFAVKEGVKMGYTEFLLFGVTGQRLDHTLANVSALFLLDSLSLKGRIIDDFSEMEVVSSKPVLVNDGFSYFSLVSLDGEVRGLNIKNALFPLEGAKVDINDPYCISNEVIKGLSAQVSVEKGRLLLIKVY